MRDERIVKWTGWLDGMIKNNIFAMHLQRLAWREVSAMLAENADALPPSYWWEFMRDTYATTQAVAVRRQADTMRGVASLAKLVEEVAGDASRITRRFFLSHENTEDPYWARVAEQNGDEHYAGEVHQHLDPAVPRADLAAIRGAAASVRDYVDKHVAHAEASPAAVTLTLDDVHDAIDVLGDVFKKYDFLIQGASWACLEPAIQHNWMAAFTVPWMKVRERPRRSG